jgi:DNA-binding beta-propeller fold protein YncE
MAAGASALDVEYIGSIEEGLHTPTSIVAGEDMVAVLDPYVGSISFFSPDGPVIRKIHLSGDAHSLTRLSGQLYAFCDRARNVVVTYDYINDRQYDELDTESGLSNPVDIAYDGSQLLVLDAGNSAIFIFDENRSLQKIVALSDDNGEKLKYASSFIYDTRGQQYYVMDQTQSRICRFDDNGNFLGSLARFGAGDGEITRAGEIELTTDGRIIVTDRFQGRVAVFSIDGRFLGDFGGGQSGETPLAIPTGISIDENGLLYVVSSMGASISIFHLPQIPDDADLVTIVYQ